MQRKNSNGAVHERIDKVALFRRGRVWQANFQHEGKQRRQSLQTRNKKEARQRAIKLEHQLLEGRYQPKLHATKISEAIEAYQRYLRTERRAAKTLVKYDAVLANFAKIADAENAKSMADVSLTLFDAFRTARVQKKIAAKTLYTESVIVRQWVNFALSRGMVAADPLPGLKIKKPKRTTQPCWTFEEVQQILDGCAAEVKPAFILLAETGMRFGELAWLTWGDIDLGKNVLHIRAKDGWRPKSMADRVVPLSTRACQILQTLPTSARWVVPMPASPSYSGNDRQWSERRLLTALKRRLKALGLLGKLHTFRHFFISNALEKGISEAQVRHWVGHVDAEIMKHYTHVHDSASQAAMQRLADAHQPVLQTEDFKGGEKAQNQHKPQ